jgi:hypothetical protein
MVGVGSTVSVFHLEFGWTGIPAYGHVSGVLRSDKN